MPVRLPLLAARSNCTPPPKATDSETARFWVDLNVARWHAALNIEAVRSPVVCDTDPLKLHYVWGLWQIGEGSKEQWTSQLAESRKAILDKRIGFADAYIIGEIEPELARQRRNKDETRQRRQFDLHVQLQPSLLIWYRALSAILPSHFSFGFPEAFPWAISPRPEARYDVSLFDQLIVRLPQGTAAA